MMSDADKLNEIIVKIPLLPSNKEYLGLMAIKGSLMAHKGGGEGKYYVNYLGRVIFLDFGYFW